MEFDTDEQSEVIYQKVRSGTLKGVSVGYRIDSLEEVMAGKTTADGRFSGPAEIARKWWPFEISIVSVPADGVRRKCPTGPHRWQSSKANFRLTKTI